MELGPVAKKFGFQILRKDLITLQVQYCIEEKTFPETSS